MGIVAHLQPLPEGWGEVTYLGLIFMCMMKRFKYYCHSDLAYRQAGLLYYVHIAY